MGRLSGLRFSDRRGACLSSFLCGAAVFTGEYVFCLLHTASFAVMGVQVQKIEDLVFSGFKGVIFLHQIKVLIAYVFIGGAIGCAAGFILHLYSSFGAKEIRPRRALLAVAVFTFAASLAFLFNDISFRPALYNEYLYSRGGVLRWVQVALTDYIPRPLGALPAFLAILVFFPLLLGMAAAVIRATVRIAGLTPRWGKAGLSVLIALFFTTWLMPRDTNEGPNILIIAADSFRYDRVSALGGITRNGVSLTPHIDALAREGVSLDDFHVQLPRTFPSWYTLLTGRYPFQHGIRHMFPRRRDLERVRIPLTDSLRQNGYTTAAVADYAGDIFSRMACFDRVRAPRFTFDTMIRQRGLEIHFMLLPYLQNRLGRILFPEMKAFAQNSDPRFLIGEVRRELSSLSGKKRFFLCVFCSVTHFPYASPYPYYRRFARTAYRGEYKYLKINDPTRLSVTGGDDQRQIRDLFDGACSAVDDTVGEIMSALKERGMYENTIVIFTADHGENLYDHGLDLGHGEHFRGEFSTHVPFIIKPHKGYAPRLAIRRYGGVVEQVDVAPTLLHVLNLGAGGSMAGKSLRGVLEGRSRYLPRIAYAETGIWFVDSGEQFFQRQRIRYPDVSVLCRLEGPENDIVLREEYDGLINIAKHRTVFDDKYKVIYIPTRSGVRFELYRRGDNSYVNLYRKDHPDFQRLYRHLADLLTRHEGLREVNGMFLPR